MSRSPNPWRSYVDIRRGPGPGGWCAYVKGTGDRLNVMHRMPVHRVVTAFKYGGSFSGLAVHCRVDVVHVENAVRFWFGEMERSRG